MFKNKRLLLSFFVIAMVSFFFCERVNALSIDEKINGYGVYLCYTDNPSGVYPVKDKISLEKYKTWSDIFDPLHQGSVSTKSTESNLRPTNTCKGIFSSAGKTANTSNDSNKRLALEKYGYVGKTTGQCIQFSFNRTELVNGEPKGQAVPVTVQGLCSSDPNNLTKENVWIDKNSDISWPIGFLYSNSTLLKMGVYDPETNQTIYPNNYFYTIGGSLSSMKDKIDGDVRSYFDNNGGTIRSNKYLYTQAGSSLVDAAENSKKSEYELENRAQSAFKLLGISSVSDLMFAPEEKYTLYNGYLSSIFGINASNIVCDQEESPGSNYVLGAFAQGGTYRACWATALKNDGQTVNALSGNYFNGKSKKTWQELVQELYEEFKDQIGETAVEEPQEQGETGEEEYDACYDAGVDGISWIACPAINNMTSTIDATDATLDALLSIDNAFYENGSVAQGAWRAFRDIANIVMTIILLVIVVSQITGYGIDNYGIKKMLPKLIVMAILVNFSFLICQIAIDVSNIVGAGASSMFKTLGGSLSSGLTPGSFITSVTAALIGLASGVGASSGVIISLVGIVMNPGFSVMLIIGLVLSLLVAMVSIIMFFLTVGARGIIVVLCAAISPLAFVCYILPNTQSVFKTWWKVFQASLLVYPICGIMYGISFVIRAIVFQDGTGVHPLMALVGVMSPFLPFLAMPSLLRNALNAMGNIGGAFSNVGNSLRTGLRRGADAFKNTEEYRDAQKEVALNRQNAMAQRTIDRIQRKMASGGVNSLSAADRRRLAKARSTVLANTARINKEDNLVSDVGYEAALSSAEMDADNAEFKAYQNVISGYSRAELERTAQSSANWYDGSRVSQNRMKALIGAMESNGMQNSIYSMLGTTNVGGSSKVMQSLASSSDKVLKAYGKRGGGQSYNDFMDNGGMKAYAQEKGTDFVKDLDDKSLGEIVKHTSSSNQIMDGTTLSAAAATINAQDAVNNIDRLVERMPANEITFTPSELISYNASTIETLANRRDAGIDNKLIAASNQIASNPELSTKLRAPQRDVINRVRTSRGQRPI